MLSANWGQADQTRAEAVWLISTGVRLKDEEQSAFANCSLSGWLKRCNFENCCCELAAIMRQETGAKSVVITELGEHNRRRVVIARLHAG
jgi:hypothetical protein